MECTFLILPSQVQVGRLRRSPIQQRCRRPARRPLGPPLTTSTGCAHTGWLLFSGWSTSKVSSFQRERNPSDHPRIFGRGGSAGCVVLWRLATAKKKRRLHENRRYEFEWSVLRRTSVMAAVAEDPNKEGTGLVCLKLRFRQVNSVLDRASVSLCPVSVVAGSL